MQLLATAGCASSLLRSRKQLGCPAVACGERIQLRGLLWMPLWEIPLPCSRASQPGGSVSAPSSCGLPACLVLLWICSSLQS